MRPTECKWCGCGVVHSSSASHVKFTCRSSWIDSDLWACGIECSDNMSDRIMWALEKLKAAERYRVAPVSRTHVEWWRTPDGPWAESVTLDDVARILEGDSDEQT